MNPQLNILQKNNMLVPFENLVLSFTSSTWQSSHELKAKVQHSPLYTRLLILLSHYPAARGFKEPASFVGSVCSHLAKQGRLQHSSKRCPIKESKDDVFKN